MRRAIIWAAALAGIAGYAVWIRQEALAPALPAPKHLDARGHGPRDSSGVRQVRSDELSLLVRESGNPDGPTVVLVHGYPDTSQVWDEVATRLERDFHVVAYDVRGAGGSGTPVGRGGFRLERLVADLGAVIDATSPDRPVHLVGHDWGSIQCWEAVTTDRLAGRIASYTSISGPSLDHTGHLARLPRRSAAYSPTDDRNPLRWQAARSQYITFFHLPWLPELLWRSGVAARGLVRLQHIDEGVRARAGHPAATLRSDGAVGVRLYRQNIIDRLARPRERRATIPVQVVVAGRDRYVTPHLVVTAPARWVPDLTMTRIDAGHWVVRSHPDMVAAAIRSFVTR
jgi:pimeloyl-ACP methyl ester carboxylesterase